MKNRRFLFFTQKRWRKGVEFCFAHQKYADVITTADYLSYISTLKEKEPIFRELVPEFSSFHHSSEGLCLRFELPEGSGPLGIIRRRGMRLEEVKKFALEILQFSQKVLESLGFYYSPSTPYGIYVSDSSLHFPDLMTEFLLRRTVAKSSIKPFHTSYEYFMFVSPEHYVKGEDSWNNFCRSFALFVYYLRYGVNPFLDLKKGKLPSFEEYLAAALPFFQDEDPVSTTATKLWRGELKNFQEIEEEVRKWEEKEVLAPKKGEGRKEKLERKEPSLKKAKLRMPIKLALILLLFIVASPILYFYLNYFKLPDLKGKELWKCYVYGGTYGFKVKVAGKQFSDVFEEGSVISQNPAPNTVLRKGSTVRVVISKGREYVELPDVRGKLLTEAEEMLEKRGLQIKEVVRLRRTDVPKNVVIDLEAENSESGLVPRGSGVVLFVSTGGEIGETLVPDVRGEKIQRAIDRLTKRGLRLIGMKVLKEEGAEDTVLKQSIGPMTKVQESTGISLTCAVSPYKKSLVFLYPLPQKTSTLKLICRSPDGTFFTVFKKETVGDKYSRVTIPLDEEFKTCYLKNEDGQLLEVELE